MVTTVAHQGYGGMLSGLGTLWFGVVSIDLTLHAVFAVVVPVLADSSFLQVLIVIMGAHPNRTQTMFPVQRRPMLTRRDATSLPLDFPELPRLSGADRVI